MSNIPEETGSTARSAISALKGNPLCLAVVLLVVVLSVIAYFREREAQNNRTAMVQELIERCMEPSKR